MQQKARWNRPQRIGYRTAMLRYISRPPYTNNMRLMWRYIYIEKFIVPNVITSGILLCFIDKPALQFCVMIDIHSIFPGSAYATGFIGCKCTHLRRGGNIFPG